MARASANLKIIPGQNSPRRDRGEKVVPWKEMERRVAERIAAKAAGRQPPTKSGRSDIPPWKQSPTSSGSIESYSEERAPDSGVRASEPRLDIAAFASEARPLTFTVYSVEELDARQRVSAPPPSIPPPPPSRWPDAWRSTKALMRAWVAWYQTPKPRSRMMDVCGVPFATLRADVFAALGQLPWKKIFVRGGIGLASFFFLLFIVLTAAELTDDLKPSASRLTSGSTTGSNVETTNALVAPKPVAVAAPSAAPEPEAPAIELEDTTPPAAKKPVIPAKKPPPAKKKKKGADIFNP